MKWIPKTKTEKTLLDMLTNIWNDEEFLVGVMNDLESDGEREKVIRFINENKNVSAEKIVLLSTDIDLSRK